MFKTSKWILLLAAMVWLLTACKDDVPDDDLDGDDSSTGSDLDSGSGKTENPDSASEWKNDSASVDDASDTGSSTSVALDSDTATTTGTGSVVEDSDTGTGTTVTLDSDTATGTAVTQDSETASDVDSDTDTDTVDGTDDTAVQDTETETVPECYGKKKCDGSTLMLCGETDWFAYKDCADEGTLCEQFGEDAALCVAEEEVATAFNLETISQLSIPPAGVRVVFSVKKDNGMPASGLTDENFAIINDETGLPFNEGGSEPAIGESEGVDFYTILTLDMSDSMFTPEGNNSAVEAVAAAKRFVQNHVAGIVGNNSHYVAIYAFGSTAQSELVQDFTDDVTVLNAQLDELLVSGSRGGTNLYGAYIASLDTIRTIDTTSGLVRTSMILLSDGLHESGNKDVMRDEALASLSLGGVGVFALAMPGDYDEAELKELASMGFYFYSKDDGATVSQQFDLVGDTMAYMTGGNYVVGVCSPLETASSFTITATQGDLTGSLVVAYSADAEDWTGDVSQCDEAEIADPCLNQQCGASAFFPGFECGGCPGATEYCDQDGMCTDDCENLFCGMSLTSQFSCGTCAEGFVCGEQQTCELDNQLIIEAECAFDMAAFACDSDYPGASSNPGNTEDGVPRLAEDNLVGYTNGDSWIAFENIDFNGLKSISLKYSTPLDPGDAGMGFVVRVDQADGSQIGVIDTVKTGDEWNLNFELGTFTLGQSSLRGKHTVYFVGILAHSNNGNLDHVVFEYDR